MAVARGREFLNPSLSKITLGGFSGQMDGELCWQNYTPERLNLSECNLTHRALTLPFIEVNFYWPLQQQPAQGLKNFCRRCGRSNSFRSRSCPDFHWFPSPFQLPAYNVLMIAQPQTSWLFIQREMIFGICIHYLRQKENNSPCLLCQHRASVAPGWLGKKAGSGFVLTLWRCSATSGCSLASFLTANYLGVVVLPKASDRRV